MTADELYATYARWTGQLHWYLAHIGQHLDVEYVPDEYLMKLYEGRAEADERLPNLVRPYGELSVTLKLLRPEDEPDAEDLEDLLRTICFSASRILGINIGTRNLLDAPPGRYSQLDQPHG